MAHKEGVALLLGMRRAAIILGLVSAAVLAGCTLLGPEHEWHVPASYFPLSVGNEWAYVSDDSTSDGGRWVDTVRVFGTAEIAGAAYFLFDREGRPYYLRHGQNGHLMRYLDVSEAAWLLLEAEDGAVYTTPDSSDASDRVTVERKLGVTTPSGFYEDCIRFTFTNSFYDSEESVTLAPGVGIVVWRRTWGTTYRLVRFTPSPQSG